MDLRVHSYHCHRDRRGDHIDSLQLASVWRRRRESHERLCEGDVVLHRLLHLTPGSRIDVRLAQLPLQIGGVLLQVAEIGVHSAHRRLHVTGKIGMHILTAVIDEALRRLVEVALIARKREELTMRESAGEG